MLRSGDLFENTATRETGHVITGATDTDGRYMQCETLVRPGGGVPMAHRHPEITECFECVEGELTLMLDGRIHKLTAGEQMTVPPGATHQYSNTSDQDTVYRCGIWPAARFEEMVLTIFALAAEGKTDAKGNPSPLQMAVILAEYGDVMDVVGPPRWLQRLVIPLLARIGRARGLRARYPHHDAVYAAWQQDLAAAAA